MVSHDNLRSCLVMTTTEFIVSTHSQEEKDILIAILAEAGATGFEEERSALKVYVPDNAAVQIVASILIDLKYDYKHSILPERNWNAEWEAGFQPVVIGNFCCIRASFHASPKQVQYDIIINPKMSFGTGHHATTRLMIECMRE